jgi:signal transduction histidine kinase
MNVKIGNSGYSFIIDSQGTVLIHPDESLLMTTKIQEADPSLESVLIHFDTAELGSYSYRYQARF